MYILFQVVLNYIFPTAILLHLIMSVLFFNDICAGSQSVDSNVCDKIFGEVIEIYRFVYL